MNQKSLSQRTFSSIILVYSDPSLVFFIFSGGQASAVGSGKRFKLINNSTSISYLSFPFFNHIPNYPCHEFHSSNYQFRALIHNSHDYKQFSMPTVLHSHFGKNVSQCALSLLVYTRFEFLDNLTSSVSSRMQDISET